MPPTYHPTYNEHYKFNDHWTLALIYFNLRLGKFEVELHEHLLNTLKEETNSNKLIDEEKSFLERVISNYHLGNQMGLLTTVVLKGFHMHSILTKYVKYKIHGDEVCNKVLNNMEQAINGEQLSNNSDGGGGNDESKKLMEKVIMKMK